MSRDRHIVGWMDSEWFDRHINGANHPECPERLTAIREGLAARNLDTRLIRTLPPPVDRELLERIHTAEYVRQVEALCLSGGGYLDPDTAVVPDSFTSAMYAAGATADAVKRVIEGSWKRALCTVRPPGHHAPPSKAMGFCLFANAGIAAQAALDCGLQRVAILDWDVHHGNGTQAIFWLRSDVFYASWHQFPLYPGTGAAREIGEGPGIGTTLNCPLPTGAGDLEYQQVWDQKIRPALEEYAPEMLIISAGFDADQRDPLAGLQVTPAGFESLSASIISWADSHCDGRVVSVLEGGYSLEALAEDVALHADTLL
jgi:acetoin utilization deacetylase AcuC-like enzyme